MGRVGSCQEENDAVERIQSANPDQIIMVGGYCHTSLETYVRVESVTVLSRAPIPRLTEAEVPPEQRQFVPASLNLPGYDRHLDAARRLITAVAQGDAEAYERLESPEKAEPGEEGLLVGNREAQASFRHWRGDRPLFAAILRDRYPMQAFVAREWLDDPGDEVPLIACWCKTRDCSGRWPIHRADADNASGRPYLCVATGLYTIYGKGETVMAELRFLPGGFAEPRWSRPR